LKGRRVESFGRKIKTTLVFNCLMEVNTVVQQIKKLLQKSLLKFLRELKKKKTCKGIEF
jgi:hypothetical protein